LYDKTKLIATQTLQVHVQSHCTRNPFDVLYTLLTLWTSLKSKLANLIDSYSHIQAIQACIIFICMKNSKKPGDKAGLRQGTNN